ncbi:VWA domain-containing protein [Butyrivibrio sp. JL13D10]|uniref:VWA domain-containing protein n=1 Tax=Butyrivibrio sp. JL13D10 TaxID=3236815 RepID=UPI0038B4759F
MMRKKFWMGYKKAGTFVVSIMLGISFLTVSPVRALALTPAEEKAYKKAQEAANEAYNAAKEEEMDDWQANQLAQEASEKALETWLPYYQEYEADVALKDAEIQRAQEAEKAAQDLLESQTTAIQAQTDAISEISELVEALGKEEEEEKEAVVKVAETKTSSENPCVTWYLKGIQKKIVDSEAFIGSRSVEIAEKGRLGDGEGPAPKTLLLVDNSNSMSKYKDKIKTILTRLVWNHQPDERFSLVAFGEDVDVLLDFTDNYDDVRMAVDGMTYFDQPTYLRNILYDEIKAMIDDGEDDFNRIIIFSDGTEESRLGVTYEELTDLVKSDAYKCPIYTIGCHYQPAVGDLDKLFALSRRTSSPYFALDDYQDVNEIADIIREDDKSIRFFRFSVPDDLRDGSTKSIGLHLMYDEGDYMFAHSTQVPIASADVLKEVAAEKQRQADAAKKEKDDLKNEVDSLKAAGEKSGEDENQEEVTGTEEAEESQEDSDDPFGENELVYGDDGKLYGFSDVDLGDLLYYYIFNNAIWISVILLGINLVYVRYKSKQAKSVKRIEEEEQLEQSMEEDLKSDIESAIYLFEANRPDVRYTIKKGEEKVIGRSRGRSDITFPLDKALSARQACIRVEGDENPRAILENLDTQGGTSVDGQTVSDEVVLRNGARIKLGSTILEVRYE